MDCIFNSNPSETIPFFETGSNFPLFCCRLVRLILFVLQANGLVSIKKVPKVSEQLKPALRIGFTPDSSKLILATPDNLLQIYNLTLQGDCILLATFSLSTGEKLNPSRMVLSPPKTRFNL